MFKRAEKYINETDDVYRKWLGWSYNYYGRIIMEVSRKIYGINLPVLYSWTPIERPPSGKWIVAVQYGFAA